MDKRMHLSEKMFMENNDANQDSNGESFVRRVASFGLLLKFKVDKYGTLPSKQTVSSQEVMMSSGKQNVREPLDNFEANCSANAIPLLDQSEIISAPEARSNKISLFHNAKVAPPGEIVNTVVMVNNRTTMLHTCNECGKTFKEIRSLHGHKGVHRREEYKRKRMMEQDITVKASQVVSSPKPQETKKHEIKTMRLAARTLERMLMELKRQRRDHFSASITSSNKHISADEETDEMREVAEILVAQAQSSYKDSTVHVSSSSSIAKCFVYATCNKKFSSYHALGGHMSIHNNKPTKHILVEEGGAGSCGGDRRKQCTRKHVCNKCNEKFPTGQILGGHKRKHLREEHHEMQRNVKPSLPILPHNESERSGQVVVPTDENIQPAGTGLVVAAHTLPLAGDDVQQPQQAMSLGNEIELPVISGVPDEDVV